jgi:transcriptional regulator with XRE-family HTH domain
MAELAKKAAVTDAYIAQLETGKKTNPSLEVLKRLARALGVPVTELLE